MIITRSENNSPYIHNMASFEIEDSFKYLCSLITNRRGYDNEIQRRLTMKPSAIVNENMESSSITREPKWKLVNAFIFPLATYAAEPWTMSKTDRKKIEAFELRVYRRLLKVSWVEQRTNQSIPQQLNVNTRILKKINNLDFQYFGHIARRTLWKNL